MPGHAIVGGVAPSRTESEFKNAAPAKNSARGNVQQGELRKVLHQARKRLDHISDGQVSEDLADLLEEELS